MTDASETPRGMRVPISKIAVWLAFAALPLGVLAEVWARWDDNRQFGTPWNASPDFKADLMIHDSLGVRGRPNGQYMGWKFNSAGFRASEAELQPKPGCPSIITMGSSETLGYMERPGKEYPAQLATLLSANGCYRVMNAAIAGMSLPGIMQLYSLWVSRFTPNYVVLNPNPIAYVGDDPPRIPERVTNGANLVPRPGKRPRFAAKLKEMITFPAFIQERRVARMLEQNTAGKPDDWYIRTLPQDRLKLYRDDLVKTIAMIRANGSIPILLVHPIRYASMQDGDAASAMQAMRQSGPRVLAGVLFSFDSAGAEVVRGLEASEHVAIVDLPKLMNGKHELFSDPVHYSEAGAAVVAAEVARVVRTPPASVTDTTTKRP